MLQHWRDFLHSMAFSISFQVVLTYWIIYAIDPFLVDSFYAPPRPGYVMSPHWFKQGVSHGAVLVFMFVDKWISFHRYPRRLYGCLATLGLATLYSLWAAFQSWYANSFPYRFMQKLDVTSRVFVYIGTIVFMFWYLVGEAITKLIWSKQISRTIPHFTNQQQSESYGDGAEKQKEEETQESSTKAQESSAKAQESSTSLSNKSPYSFASRGMSVDLTKSTNDYFQILMHDRSDAASIDSNRVTTPK